MPDENQQHYRIYVSISYIDQSSATERQILSEQNWVFDKDQRSWVVATEHPFEIAKHTPMQ